MSESQAEEKVAPGAPPRAQFRLAHLLWWLPLCLVHGTAVAWIAYGVQKNFAPLGLFPILIGLGLGVTLAGLMRLVQVANRTTILLGLIVACTAAVAGQHYFSYREQRETAIRQAAEFRIAAEAHPGLVQGSPPQPASGLVEYLRWQAIRGRPIWGDVIARRGMAWVSWAVDACLVFAAALAVVVPASRQPFCNQCRTWFSTVRRGRFSASAGENLAAALGSDVSGDIQEGTYRIVDCQGGCGIAGFEICWELAEGGSNVKRVWVSREDRAKLDELLAPVSQAKA